jgi:hypothetical protein
MVLRGSAASSKGKGREIADHIDGAVATLVFLEMPADKGELRTELARLPSRACRRGPKALAS